jgi:hypothetical protein
MVPPCWLLFPESPFVTERIEFLLSLSHERVEACSLIPNVVHENQKLRGSIEAFLVLAVRKRSPPG